MKLKPSANNGTLVEDLIKFFNHKSFFIGKSSITIYSGETAIMCIRGWGMLTGYPYRKDPKEAELIHNTFRDYIIEMLNK